MKNNPASIENIPIGKILVPEIFQRRWNNPPEFNELCTSVKKEGILSPIIVRRKNEIYEIVKGGRRIQAARKAGLKVIPSIIRDLDDTEMLLVRLTMYRHQEKPSVFDEALLFDQLLRKMNRAELAKKQGISPKLSAKE